MPFELPEIDQAKLAALRALKEDAHVFEVVKIGWPSPTGTRYYADTELHEITPSILDYTGNAPVAARLAIGDRENNGAGLFLRINYESALADEEVELKFWDGLGDFADLAYLHGEGVPVEIFYWFPQVELLLSQWMGHLRPPKTADAVTYTATAANGFRSPNLNTPHRSIGYTECQATYGGLLQTLEEVAANACDYNRHLGGLIGKLEGGLPILTCTRKSREECRRHFSETNLPFLGAQAVYEALALPQIHTPTIYGTSIGNETNLKEPLRVVFGYRVVRNLKPLAYTPQPNPSTPDHGFIKIVFPISEGPVQSVSLFAVNNALIGAEHLVIRLGLHRQSDSGYTTSGPNAPNYSRTVHAYANWGWVNPGNYNAANLTASAAVVGLSNIRVYSTPTEYEEMFTTNRAWCLMEILRNTVWGHGLDIARLEISDWIALAAYSEAHISWTEPDGTVWQMMRGNFNADLSGRSTQQQINDICMAGGFGLPFTYLGKVRILPLTSATEEELTAAPLFTDGTIASVENQRNIIADKDTEQAKITRSQKSDQDLPNQIVVTFDDAAHGNIERPITCIDQPAQLRSGQAAGDKSRREVEKKYTGVGIVSEGEARRFGNTLLDLGEFESGGLKNNLQVKFTTWFSHALELHRYKIIRVLSAQLTRYGFEYFRVQDMERNSDLTVEITAQAYPVGYHDEVETVITSTNPYQYEAEAEVNELIDGPELAEDAFCSGDQKVINIGGSGRLMFNAISADNGFARVGIFYKSDTDCDFFIRANNGAAKTVHAVATGNLPKQAVVVLDMNAGDENTITIFYPAGVIPLEVDRILVVPFDIDPGGGGPCRPTFNATYANGRLNVEVQPC